MKCEKCGSFDFDRPEEKSALEIWYCKKCGNEVPVHCHHIPDLSALPTHELFIGTVSIKSEAEALKSLFKLKKVLAFAERFEPLGLEEQHRAGKLTWNLGYFLDFEVAQAKAECLRIGVTAAFCKVERMGRMP
ncbi:hypothetical protein [Duganella hordei]|uniref:hypothetical protein n=1 Tax=Duganella hordei TaxID=2865934 RepID=UPI0030E94386